MNGYTCIGLVILLFAYTADGSCRLYDDYYRCEAGVPADLITILDNATKISIIDMYMDRIDKSLLSRFASTLEELDFVNCHHLADIDADAFSKLTKLRGLSLYGTALTSVNAKWFKATKSLQTLKLSSNKINYIEKDAFSNLRNLMILELDGTNLVELRRKWFGNMDLPLSSFYFRYNNVKIIDNNVFGIFPKLESFHLDQCNLTEVRTKWFENTFSVTSLYLNNIKISELDELLKKAIKLEWLEVAHNDLQCVDIENIIMILPKLKFLRINLYDYAECRNGIQEMAKKKSIFVL